MATRKLLNEKTGELEDIDDSLVERYINRGGYRFGEGEKIPVQSGGSAYHLLDPDEAYNYIRTKNARYMGFEEYEKKRDEADFTDFGGDMAAAALGAVEYIGTPLATAALGVAGDIGAEYLNKWFDLGLGSASDYITKSAEYNPWWYHGAGVAGTVAVGAALGAGGGSVVAPGIGTVGGAIAGGAAAAGKAGAQRAAMAGAAGAARAAEIGRLKKLWNAIAGVSARTGKAVAEGSKLQSATKLGRAAEMTPVGWTMKMSNMSRNQLTRPLSDKKVNEALSKLNPGLANMFKAIPPAGKEAAKYSFGATATAGMVNAAAEGALFWGPTTAVKEMILSNEDMTLEEASGYIFEEMRLNAFFGAAFSGAIDGGLKGAVWSGQKAMDTAGKAYHWMGDTKLGQTANDWWRAGAKNFSGMDADSQRNLDYAFQSGKEGYEARQAILYMKNWYSETVDRVKRTTNSIWAVQDFIEQADIGAAYKPEFVSGKLKQGIAAGKISGDYVPAAADAVDTLSILEQRFDEMLGKMKLEPDAPSVDPRIGESFRALVENARVNIGRGVVEESRTALKSTEADEALVQEAKSWYSTNKERLRESFIEQYGFLFEDPNAAVRTTTGRRPKWFDEDLLDEGEEGLAASPRGGVLEEEAAFASSDYIDRTGLRIVDEDQFVLEQHPDYDPETGKVLVPHEERNRLWSQLLGIRPLQESLEVNIGGHRFRYLNRSKRWQDSRGNYLQTDPKNWEWSKKDLPAHRAPFNENFIEIGGQVTQNPVQYEHYIDKKTGKVVKGKYGSREAFEDVQDKAAPYYPHAPRPLAAANRTHFSQKLNDVEGEIASLQNAAKVIEEQIEAARSGAPVPLTRVGRRQLLAPLAESGVPAQLDKLDDSIDAAQLSLREVLRENPVAQASDFSDLPREAARKKAVKLRAERLKKVNDASDKIKDLQRQRREIESSAGPDLEAIFEIQNARLSEELTEKAIRSGRLHDQATRAEEDIISKLNSIPHEIISAQDENYLVAEAIFDWMEGVQSRLHTSQSIGFEGGETSRLPIEAARRLAEADEAAASHIRDSSTALIQDMNEYMDSFRGKKQLIRAIKNHSARIADQSESIAREIREGIKVHDSRAKSPASLQHTLNSYTKRKQAVRSELYAKQKAAAALEEKLAAIPHITPGRHGAEAAEAHSQKLSKEYLAHREAMRAHRSHVAQEEALRDDLGVINTEWNRVKGIAEAAKTKEAKKEASLILKSIDREEKRVLKQIRKLRTRKYIKEEKRLWSEYEKAELSMKAAEASGEGKAPVSPELAADGSVVRPSAARLSELSRGNITDAEKATLAGMQSIGYKGGPEKGFDATGKRRAWGPKKGEITYDDDLVHTLEHIRKSYQPTLEERKRGAKKWPLSRSAKMYGTVKAGPGRVPGRDIADEMGPDPTRGELGAPTSRIVDEELPERVSFKLKDKEGRLIVQPKGLGFLDKRFGVEGQPVEIFIQPSAPPPPPLEKFDELISEAIETGDGTKLENLMRAMGFFDDMQRVSKQAYDKPGTSVDMRRHEVQSYDEFWGFKRKPAERLMPGEDRVSVRDIKDAIERIKSPERETVLVQSQLIKDIERAMMDSRSRHDPSEWGNELATRLAEEEKYFQFAIDEARSTGNLQPIMEVAGKYGVQVKSSDMLGDLFHAMHGLKNELHYVHSHQHVGKRGSEIFEEAADLVDQFLMGASPRPAQSGFPQRRNHFGNSEEGTGMAGVMGDYKQQMAKASSLRSNLEGQFGQEDPDALSPAAMQTSEQKIRDWLLNLNQTNANYEMDTLRAYLNNNDELFTKMLTMFDTGKFEIRNTRKMNEAFEAAGIGRAKNGREAFSKIRHFIKENRSKVNGLSSQMNSRKFKAQMELGIKSGGGSSWVSSLGPLGGLSLGAFMLHPAAAAVVASAGVTMMNPRATAIRLAQMEKMASSFHKGIQDRTNRFIYDTITGKEPTAYRQSIARALIGPSAPLRNQSELEEYQRTASEREIASDEFLRTREFITNLVHNEKAMVDLVDRAVPPGIAEYAPTVRKHMQDRLRIKIMAAYESMPKTFSSEFMSSDSLPSTMEMSKWARDLQAIQDPLGTLMEGLSSGSLPKAEGQMIQKTAPEVYQETVRRIVEGFSDPMIQSRIPYKMKVQLTTLLGVRFTKPSTVRALQQAFEKREKSRDQQRFERVMQSTQQSAGSTIDTVERSQ